MAIVELRGLLRSARVRTLAIIKPHMGALYESLVAQS